jgi:hypothetical protein
MQPAQSRTSFFKLSPVTFLQTILKCIIRDWMIDLYGKKWYGCNWIWETMH